MNLPVALLCCVLCGALTALWVVCHRLGQQERKMEEAARQIAEYILDRRH